MSPQWKPEGYPDASPYLIVEDAGRIIRFLAEAFDGEERRRYEDPAGGILHVEVQVGDSVIMLADAAEGWPPVRSYIHLYVPDADAAFRAGVQAGGRAVQEPARRPGDPDRRGGVEDPAGNVWWVATQERSDSPPEDREAHGEPTP
jgi:uncharacterized glyoxalase superfamily protein PhnB